MPPIEGEDDKGLIFMKKPTDLYQVKLELISSPIFSSLTNAMKSYSTEDFFNFIIADLG